MKKQPPQISTRKKEGWFPTPTLLSVDGKFHGNIPPVVLIWGGCSFGAGRGLWDELPEGSGHLSLNMRSEWACTLFTGHIWVFGIQVGW